MATKKLKKKSRSKKRDALPDAEKPVVIRTHAPTPADVEILERLTQDTRDYTGQTISSSALVRALLRFADSQGYQWMLTNICPIVESEYIQGVRWGGKKE